MSSTSHASSHLLYFLRTMPADTDFRIKKGSPSQNNYFVTIETRLQPRRLSAHRAALAMSGNILDVTNREEMNLSTRDDLASVDMAATSSSSHGFFASVQSAKHSSPTAASFRIGPFDGVEFLLSIMACTVSIAISVIFVYAIPALRAMQRAAKAFEKLADTLREELPATMAAVRLSGMEISDLTMELSDLSQEISQGVRSSSRAVQAAEDGLRRIRNYASTQTISGLQERAESPSPVAFVGPTVASAARSTREVVVQVRQTVKNANLVGKSVGWVKSILPFKKSSKGGSSSSGGSNQNVSNVHEAAFVQQE